MREGEIVREFNRERKERDKIERKIERENEGE